MRDSDNNPKEFSWSARGVSIADTTPPASHLELLLASARTANAAGSAESAARDLIRLILEATGWSAGGAYLGLGSDAAGWLWITAGAPAGDTAEPVVSASGPAEGSLGAAALADGRVHVDDSTQAGPHCACAVPIRRRGGTVVGVLEFHGEQAFAVDADFEQALIEIGDQLGWVVARDWRQRARLLRQETLAQGGRLASMRELARNLAHEVNQPLAAVVGYAGGALQLLEQGRGDEEKMRRALEQVGVQAQRASRIIQEFRESLRREDPRHEALDLEVLLRNTAGLMSDAAREAGISIHLALPPDPPPIVGDLAQLQQVLINLIQNAIDAMRGTQSGERRLDVSATVGDQLEIVVRDTGIGMPPEQLPQLFTPFLTNKPHGLGMGLPISRSIVEFHGGRISGENNPDGGMSFRLRLPLARP